MNNESPFLTVTDVAKELGIHEMTVYRLFKAKKLPSMKIGGKWYSKRELLDQFILDGHK